MIQGTHHSKSRRDARAAHTHNQQARENASWGLEEPAYPWGPTTESDLLAATVGRGLFGRVTVCPRTRTHPLARF